MYLTREPISVDWRGTPNYSAGATILFLGKVRDHSAGRSVLYLEYEAYEEMAEKLIGELVESAYQKWPLEAIGVIHRLGRVELGDIVVAISVESAHRDEAYQGSRYLIEEIKHRVPIWKKEYYADGTSEWSQCNPLTHAH